MSKYRLKKTPPIMLLGTPPKKCPVFTPTSLPSVQVFTMRGWVHFDEWGRERRITPQPAPPEHYQSLVSTCSYQDLRKVFLWLPPFPMLTEAVRKKKTKGANERKRSFFLPHKEKRKIEIKAFNAKRSAKFTAKQKQEFRAGSEAFASAFQRFDGRADRSSDSIGGPCETERSHTEEEYLEDMLPGPKTDESSSDSECEFSS